MPFDIGLYDLSWFEEETDTLYHMPIVEVVHGKGETYLGEYMDVKGWFDGSQNMEIFTNSLVDEIKGAGDYLPDYLSNYITEYLQNDTMNDLYDFAFDFTSFDVKDYFRNYLDGLRDYINETLSDYISGLRTELQTRLEELRSGLNYIITQIDNDVNYIDSDLIEKDLENIILSASQLRNEIYNLRGKIASEIREIIRLIDEDENNYFDFSGPFGLFHWGLGDFRDKVNDFLEGNGWNDWEGYINDPNNFQFLDTLKTKIDDIWQSLNNFKSTLSSKVDNIIARTKELSSDLGNISTQIITEFDNYIDNHNLTSELETWFDDFFNDSIDNIPTDLITNITDDLTCYLLEEYGFYSALAQSTKIELIEGYILVYKMESSEF